MKEKKQGAVTHRGTTSLCCCRRHTLAFGTLLLDVLPLDGTFQRWELQLHTPVQWSDWSHQLQNMQQNSMMSWRGGITHQPQIWLFQKQAKAKAFSSPSKIQSTLDLISVGTSLDSISAPNQFLVSQH